MIWRIHGFEVPKPTGLDFQCPHWRYNLNKRRIRRIDIDVVKCVGKLRKFLEQGLFDTSQNVLFFTLFYTSGESPTGYPLTILVTCQMERMEVVDFEWKTLLDGIKVVNKE
jgi:hypothetical protein